MASLALYLHILKVRWVQGGLRGLGAVVGGPVWCATPYRPDLL